MAFTRPFPMVQTADGMDKPTSAYRPVKSTEGEGARLITAGQWTALIVLIAFAITGNGACRVRKTDDELGRAVKQVLYDEPAVNLLQVDVTVDGDTVYLSGEVDLYAFKERAGQLARGVDGVTAVVNKVQVQP